MKSNFSSKHLILIVAGCFCIVLLLVGLVLYDSGWNFNLRETDQTVAYENCLQQMRRKTCKIIFGPEVDYGTELNSMFIAGYGEADGRIYQEIKASGLYMCETMKKRCQESPTDPLCRLSVNLFIDMK